MSTIVIYWFFGVWIGAFTGTVLAVISFDCWLNHRREAMRTKGAAQ